MSSLRAPFLVDLSTAESRETQACDGADVVTKSDKPVEFFMTRFDLDDDPDVDPDEDEDEFDDDEDKDEDDEEDEDEEAEDSETWQVAKYPLGHGSR
jgi:hypothetical protein